MTFPENLKLPLKDAEKLKKYPREQTMKSKVARFLKEEKAEVSSEYVILISLIAMVVFTTIKLLGQVVLGLYTRPELNQAFGS